MDINDVVKKIPYWSNLSEGEKSVLLNATVYRSYSKDEFIHGFSDACLGMIYVKSGSIRVYMISEEGREVTLFHITEGESCILSASCAMSGLSLEVELMSEADTQILAVNAGTFKELMENNIYVKCFAYELSTKRLSSVVWVMQEILFSHFDERLARLLLSIYEKTDDKNIKMTQEAMAREVNSAREVVARMLKSFAAEGWIELNRGMIKLVDIDALREIAE